MKSAADRVTKTTLATHLTSTILGDDPVAGMSKVFALINRPSQSAVENWQLQLLAASMGALSRQKKSIDDARPQDVAAVAPLFEAARRLALDDSAPPERRVAAIPLLASRKDARDADLKALTGLLSARQPVAIQQAAVAAITNSRAKNVPALLIENWKSQEPALHQDILSALIARREWIPNLLDALEAGDIRPSELNAAVQTRLLQDRDQTIKSRVAGLLKPVAVRQEVLQAYSKVPGLKGDAKHGVEVFTKTCSACHRMHDRGNDIGAKLASLTNKSTDFLLTAILDPNQAVEGQYVGYVAAMNDGRTFTGMIVEQTATSISFARPDGKRDTLLRIDIDQLSSTGKSFMPEGLEKDLNPQDVADVIAFLQAPSVP
jgi:putative heme-binding domain-containing protein